MKEAQEMVMALHIDIDEEGNIRPRTITELTNDVAVCNHIIRFFMTDERTRHKAMYLNSAVAYPYRQTAEQRPCGR